MHIFIGQLVLNKKEDHPCAVVAKTDKTISILSICGIKELSHEEFSASWELYDANYTYIVYAAYKEEGVEDPSVAMYGVYKTLASAEKHALLFRKDDDYCKVEVQRTYMPN